MAGLAECTHSVLDQVTHLATLLASNQQVTDESTSAAVVAKKRSEIYEALFRRGTMSSEQILELLCEVSSQLRKDPEQRGRLQPFQRLLEELRTRDLQGTEKKVETRTKEGFKVLRPSVLKLHEVQLMDHQIFREPLLFRSIPQLKRERQPLQLREPLWDPLPCNMNKPVGRINPTNISILTASQARIRESGQQSMPPIPKLDFLNTKRSEKLQKSGEPGSKKHFVSDLMMSNELYLAMNKKLVLSYIQEAVLIDHLKKAAAGLQSDTFMCSPADDKKLMIRPNTTLRSVLPDILADFAEPFLRSGFAYRRLSARTSFSTLTNVRVERPLNRAFREILEDFLATIRQFLLSQSAKSLPQLLLNSRSAMQLLQQLENVFQEEPRLNLEAGVPGYFLMSCIWQIIDSCTHSDFLQLLIYLLRRMSKTYFGQLQSWIYKGELDEELNEIFISRCRNTSPSLMDECSKEFFNRGYQVVNEEVPAFLYGCEQDILQCGKYNRVIKAYNAQHPVFDVEFPSITVCLTEQQLKDMRRGLAEKYSVIYQRFGWCSMQSIFQERMAAKRNSQDLMVQRTRAHLAAWEEHMRVLQLEANAQKKLRYEQLNAELELNQQKVLEKRRQEIVDELVFLKESERLEEKRQLQEKETLLKKVAQLQGLLESQDTLSPDDSSNSDRSFKSCLEGPPSRPESVIDKPEEEQAEEEEQAGKPKSPTTLRRPLDELNSNDHVTFQSELERNRKHILSSEHFQAMVNVQDSTTTGLRAHLPPPDFNANVKDTETQDQLTDLQRYRLRMQQHDSFGNYNSTEDDHTRRIQRQMQSTEDRAINRRRVMSSEYGIRLGEGRVDALHLPLELNKLHVEVPLSVTPMSITSDADFGPLTPPDHTADKDAVNNNIADGADEVEAVTVSPQSKPDPVKAVGTLLSNFKPTFILPTNFQTKSKEAETTPVILTEACNPFMARRCLQLSVMVPVNAHYALLRNEVLRIFKELRIYDHFRRLRNYFFLLDGQFGGMLTSDILDRIRAGIDPKSLSQRGVLDAMLGNALACCPADETTVTQNLHLNCTKIPDKLDFWSLEATSMLALNCKVDWPLNLVISSETIVKYGQIFGYLLKLRHVSFILDGTHQHLQRVGKLLGRGLQSSVQFRQLQVVRHKLLHFVTALQTHLVAKALQATWKSFKEDLCTANSIEDLYRHHVAYLKRMAFLTFLNRRSAKVKETIDNMLVIVLRFCKVIQSQTFMPDVKNQFVHPRFKRLLQEEAEFDKFMLYLIYLGNKAAASGYQEEIGDLICIVNFNDYYIVSEQKSVS
ncbi:uncharacterized protein Grip163 [Drosophila kikkawai]|uniref:Uncharacterized protein Grip163 n=1 Tax=Drosophila kikkawai TaxID=30033 RepID=A0A6P4IFJ8_DROKI|nr:uncharacterized protein LOC108073983 [Drosophila kikkawai]